MRAIFLLFLIVFALPEGLLACEGFRKAAFSSKDAKRELIEFAKKNKLPMFFKNLGGMNSVPVLLINAVTAPKYTKFFESSFGTSVRYQKNVLEQESSAYKILHDHAGTRVGTNLSELDGPLILIKNPETGKYDMDARQASQRNHTGIVWLDVFENVKYREKTRDEKKAARIEVAYGLSPEEMEAAKYYHLMRRSGLIRVRFDRNSVLFFGRDASGEKPKRQPRIYYEMGIFGSTREMCFDFAKGTKLQDIKADVVDVLKRLRVRKIDSLMRNEKVQSFLKQAKEKMTIPMSDVDSDKVHTPDFLVTNSLLPLLEGVLPPSLTPDKKQIAGNLIVAYDAIDQYQKLLRNLKVSGDMGYYDMYNPRATAVLIYDSHPYAEPMFRHATYVNENGNFSIWNSWYQSTVE